MKTEKWKQKMYGIKRLIAINRIQNNSFYYHNICTEFIIYI